MRYHTCVSQGWRAGSGPPVPLENAPGLFCLFSVSQPQEKVILFCKLVVFPSALEQLVHLLDLGVGVVEQLITNFGLEQFAFHN